MNRVSASRLWDFSVVMETPVSFFYDDMDKRVAKQSPRMFSNPEAQVCLREENEVFNTDPMRKQETLELVQAYYKINNRQAARYLFDLILTLAKSSYLQERTEAEAELEDEDEANA